MTEESSASLAKLTYLKEREGLTHKLDDYIAVKNRLLNSNEMSEVKIHQKKLYIKSVKFFFFLLFFLNALTFYFLGVSILYW